MLPHLHLCLPRLYPSLPYRLPPPSQLVNEIGAHFFFSVYTCDEPPLSKDYHAWLTQICGEHRHHRVLRAAIEAAGMAWQESLADSMRLIWQPSREKNTVAPWLLRAGL